VDPPSVFSLIIRCRPEYPCLQSAIRICPKRANRIFQFLVSPLFFAPKAGWEIGIQSHVRLIQWGTSMKRLTTLLFTALLSAAGSGPKLFSTNQAAQPNR
jgi:hypothetical protein